MIYVTHDQIEAMTLADKIVVLRDGRVEQVGTPRELYERPDNLFVAQFIGSPKMNVLSVAAVGDLGAGLVGAASVGVRPEHLRIVAPGEGALTGRMAIGEYTGASSLLHVRLDDGETCLVIHEGEAPEIGSLVGLAADPRHLHAFDANGLAVRRAG
jgi:ABC-type sugar transport system ATPase subunit